MSFLPSNKIIRKAYQTKLRLFQPNIIIQINCSLKINKTTKHKSINNYCNQSTTRHPNSAISLTKKNPFKNKYFIIKKYRAICRKKNNQYPIAIILSYKTKRYKIKI